MSVDAWRRQWAYDDRQREQRTEPDCRRRIVDRSGERGKIAGTNERMHEGMSEIAIFVVVRLERREQGRRDGRILQLPEALRGEEREVPH